MADIPVRQGNVGYQLKEDTLEVVQEVVKCVPRERVQQRTVDVQLHQVLDETVDVVRLSKLWMW